jgi:hypothetical protein
MAVAGMEDMCGIREDEAFEILRAPMGVQTLSCLPLVVYTRFANFLEMTVGG